MLSYSITCECLIEKIDAHTTGSRCSEDGGERSHVCTVYGVSLWWCDTPDDDGCSWHVHLSVIYFMKATQLQTWKVIVVSVCDVRRRWRNACCQWRLVQAPRRRRTMTPKFYFMWNVYRLNHLSQSLLLLLLLLVRLDRHARPRHECRRAPKVLQAAVELGCKGCGLFPAVRTEVGV